MHLRWFLSPSQPSRHQFLLNVNLKCGAAWESKLHEQSGLFVQRKRHQQGHKGRRRMKKARLDFLSRNHTAETFLRRLQTIQLTVNTSRIEFSFPLNSSWSAGYIFCCGSLFKLSESRSLTHIQLCTKTNSTSSLSKKKSDHMNLTSGD